MRTTATTAFLCFLGGSPLFAQPSYLRSSDLRTPTVESVMGSRKHWGVDAGFGGTAHRGNVDLDLLSANTQLFFSRGPGTSYLAGRMIYHSLSGRRVQHQGRVTLRHEHALGGPWKLYAFNTTGYNEFIRLEVRNKTGFGPWYDLALGQTKHGLSVGVAHVYEEFTSRIFERTQRGLVRWVGFLPISNVARFETDVYYAPALDDTPDYHFDTEVAFHTLFWKDVLGLRLAWTNEYDSRPKPRIRRMDRLWTTSVTMRLGK